jgi:hypothetical protein
MVMISFRHDDRKYFQMVWLAAGRMVKLAPLYIEASFTRTALEILFHHLSHHGKKVNGLGFQAHDFSRAAKALAASCIPDSNNCAMKSFRVCPPMAQPYFRGDAQRASKVTEFAPASTFFSHLWRVSRLSSTRRGHLLDF